MQPVTWLQQSIKVTWCHVKVATTIYFLVSVGEIRFDGSRVTMV